MSPALIEGHVPTLVQHAAQHIVLVLRHPHSVRVAQRAVSDEDARLGLGLHLLAPRLGDVHVRAAPEHTQVCQVRDEPRQGLHRGDVLLVGRPRCPVVDVRHGVHRQRPELVREPRRMQHGARPLAERPPHALDLRQLLGSVRCTPRKLDALLRTPVHHLLRLVDGLVVGAQRLDLHHVGLVPLQRPHQAALLAQRLHLHHACASMSSPKDNGKPTDRSRRHRTKEVGEVDVLPRPMLGGHVGRHRQGGLLAGQGLPDAPLEGHTVGLHDAAALAHRKLHLGLDVHARRLALVDQVVHATLVQMAQPLMPQHLPRNLLRRRSSSVALASVPRNCHRHPRSLLHRHKPRPHGGGHQGKHPTVRVTQPRSVLQQREALLTQPRPRDQVGREVLAQPHTIEGSLPSTALTALQHSHSTANTCSLRQLHVGHLHRSTRTQQSSEQPLVLEAVLRGAGVQVHGQSIVTSSNPRSSGQLPLARRSMPHESVHVPHTAADHEGDRARSPATLPRRGTRSSRPLSGQPHVIAVGSQMTTLTTPITSDPGLGTVGRDVALRTTVVARLAATTASSSTSSMIRNSSCPERHGLLLLQRGLGLDLDPVGDTKQAVGDLLVVAQAPNNVSAIHVGEHLPAKGVPLLLVRHVLQRLHQRQSHGQRPHLLLEVGTRLLGGSPQDVHPHALQPGAEGGQVLAHRYLGVVELLEQQERPAHLRGAVVPAQRREGRSPLVHLILKGTDQLPHQDILRPVVIRSLHQGREQDRLQSLAILPQLRKLRVIRLPQPLPHHQGLQLLVQQQMRLEGHRPPVEIDAGLQRRHRRQLVRHLEVEKPQKTSSSEPRNYSTRV
mmetsp:Transcript_33797/g.73891  ORF Transcript_33797/g.73891 Transcript_33797/m.73891 type:complete len:838 (-) Transcript_33797:147-2660(-)